MNVHMTVGSMWDLCITCLWPSKSTCHRRGSKNPSGQNGPFRWHQFVCHLISQYQHSEHMHEMAMVVDIEAMHETNSTDSTSVIYWELTSHTNSQFLIETIFEETNWLLGVNQVNFIVPLTSWKGQWFIRKIDT